MISHALSSVFEEYTMKRTSWIYLPCFIAALLFSGCCHVDNLRKRKKPVAAVELRLGDDPQLTLQFTRKTGTQSRRYVGVLARTNRQVLQYEQLLQDLGGGRLRRHLADRIPDSLSHRLGWVRADDDTVMDVDIDDLIFEAQDYLSAVVLTWKLELSLYEVADGSLLWRRCMDWRQDLGGLSMEGMLAMGAEHRETLLDELAKGLADHIAKLLAKDMESP